MRAQRAKRLRDLPGFNEAFEEALAAKYDLWRGRDMPPVASRVVPAQALITAGNFIAPPSIERVTVALLLSLAVGIQGQRTADRFERLERREAKVVRMDTWLARKAVGQREVPWYKKGWGEKLVALREDGEMES